MADGFKELKPEDLTGALGVNELNRMLRSLYNLVAGDGQMVRIFHGFGSPETNVVGGVGSIYLRKDGGANTSIYIKESGGGTASGWQPK